MRTKSQQKLAQRTEFFRSNLLPNQSNTQSGLISNLSFEMARLAVNQKLLYVKTCFQKQADPKDIFQFYPFSNIEVFKLPLQPLTEGLTSEEPKQNPQNSSIEEKRKIVKDEFGIHLVETVDVLSEDEIKLRSKRDKINKKRELFNGLAISIFHNGSLFEGNYHDGRFCGQCLQINEDSDLYIGHYKDGIKKGYGAYYSFGAKQVYKGNWQNDLPHGEGIYSNQQTTYEGSFSNGLRNGFGIEKFTNNDYYTGEYINGIPQGYGEYYWADGSFYKGDFSHGARHGYGIWESENQTYLGSYRMDNKEGFGVYTWKDKKIYKGQFRDDYRDGYGEIYTMNRLTKKEKLVYKGGWQKGTKQPSLQVNPDAIVELYAFLQRQKELMAEMPVKKEKVGHKNCIPHYHNEGPCKKH